MCTMWPMLSSVVCLLGGSCCCESVGVFVLFCVFIVLLLMVIGSVIRLVNVKASVIVDTLSSTFIKCRINVDGVIANTREKSYR